MRRHRRLPRQLDGLRGGRVVRKILSDPFKIFLTDHQYFCLTSFTPANGSAGTTVTIRGSGLLLVAEVRFDTDCNPATGTVAAIVTKSDTRITVTLPALAPGTHHIVATGASGSFCTATTFTVP